MTYLSWACFSEGNSDRFYFDILLPRVLEDIIARDGIRHSDIPTSPAVKLGLNGRTVEAVATEICQNSDAFELVFIHADTGGAAIAKTLHQRCSEYCKRVHELCDWPETRCVILVPRHETEAWVLADPAAILASLGYNGSPKELGLPPNAIAAERLVDPKASLSNAIQVVRGRRSPPNASQMYPAIAQRQDIEALRQSQSFQRFEILLRRALANLGAIAEYN